MTTMTTSRQTKQHQQPAAIGELLASECESRVLTQELLADQLGVDVSTVRRWIGLECVPQAIPAHRIANFLGLTEGALARAIRAQRTAVREGRHTSPPGPLSLGRS